MEEMVFRRDRTDRWKYWVQRGDCWTGYVWKVGEDRWEAVWRGKSRTGKTRKEAVERLFRWLEGGRVS